MTLSFKQVFNILVNLTNIKLSTIAFSLGYDISYISKWNSGKKLPSYKNIHDINVKLANIFSNSIIEEKKIDEFVNLFMIKNSEIIKENSEDALKAIIYKLLNDSYISVNSTANNEIKSYKNFIFKNNSIDHEFKVILKKCTLENKNMDIWATFDIFSKYSKLLIQTIKDNASKDSVINLHLFCNKEENRKNDFFKKITSNSMINFEIYEKNHNLNSNIILIKDYMYFMINNEENNYNSLNYGSEIDILLEFTSYINNIFGNSHRIISLASPTEMAKSNYRKYFYSDKEFLFLSNYGFEFLIPNSVLDRLFNNENEDYIKNKDEIDDIKLLWKEFFINSNINFLTTRTTLLNYIEKGEILYCSVKTKLKPRYIELHLENIINSMKNNPDINFYIINDDRFLKTLGLDKFNFFVNENNMYFKRTDIKGTTPTSIVEDPYIHHSIFDNLHEIIKEPFCKKYSPDELEEFFSSYLKIFQKNTNVN